MAKKCKTAKRKWNKKGAALAYTLIATMVLMILSTSLFTAAGYNISLTTKNDNARQSYITCKSAVEYAKSHILQQAEIAKNKNTERENSFSKDQTQAAATYSNDIKPAMAGFYVKQSSDPTSVSGLTTALLTDKSGTNLATCTTSLASVARTTVQTVTTSTPKSGGGFTVSAQNQTVTSKMIDTNISLDISTNWDAGSTASGAATAPVDSTTKINQTELLLVRYVFTYKIQISAANQYSASDTRTQQLNYQTSCTIGSNAKIELKPSPVTTTTVPIGPGTQGPGIGMLAVGGHYGNKNITNNDAHLGPTNNGFSDLPVVFKDTIISSGSDSFLGAPAAYFMNSLSLSVNDMLQAPLPQNQKCAMIDSDFIVFNGSINGLLDTANKQSSALLLKNTRNTLKLNNGYSGIVQFNNTTITLVSPDKSLTTKVLNGLYYFKDGTNLFDFANLDGKDGNLTQVPQADYASVSSVADENYVHYLQTNINTIISGDLKQYGGTEWLKNGNISDGTPSNEQGKTVYCYVNKCDTWINTLNNNSNAVYGAKNIMFQWDNSYSNLTVPQSKTVTFLADYMVMITNRAIKAGDSSSKLIVKSVNSTDPLTMVFPTNTEIDYFDSQGRTATYTITAGTYSAVPTGTNLFSSAADTFFKNPANHTYDGMSGIVKYGPFNDVGDKLADATTPNYLLYGAKYGSQPLVYNNVNTPEFIENTNKQGNSAYPVLFNQPVQISSDYQDGVLTAPQVYFMGADDSITGNGSASVSLNSNFIYIAGKQITGSHIYLDTFDNSGEGVIYFAQTCQLQGTGNGNGNGNGNGKNNTVTLGPGYYTFDSRSNENANYHSKVDLLNLKGNGNKSLDSITAQVDIDKIKKDNYVKYMEQQHGNIISGDTTIGGNAPTNAGANWAPNGVFSETTSGTFNDNNAYLYVNDASKWGTAAVNYQASRINLQYVNAGSLTVPAGKAGEADKEVTFTADNLSLNGQKTDAAQADDTLVLQQGGAVSQFKVRTLSGTGYVNVTLPHDLTVNKSDGSSYKVPAGVYKVKSGTNLFDYSPSSGNGTTITPAKIQIDSVKTFFNKGKYTNETNK